MHTEQFFGAAETMAVLAASTGASARAPDIDDAHRLDMPPEAIVETGSGKIRGFRQRDVYYIFRDVPYGEDTGVRTSSCRRSRLHSSGATSILAMCLSSGSASEASQWER